MMARRYGTILTFLRLQLDRTDEQTPENAASAFGLALGAAALGNACGLPPSEISQRLRTPAVASFTYCP
jgi:hypothetical protein